MRSEIFRTGAASALAFAMLLAEGCSRQAPQQVPIEEPRHVVPSNEPAQMVVCNDPGNTQCMVCDSITHQCHLPVFKLP